jgi:hypothetical protein
LFFSLTFLGLLTFIPGFLLFDFICASLTRGGMKEKEFEEGKEERSNLKLEDEEVFAEGCD